MKIKDEVISDITQVLRALSDVFGVALILIDEDRKQLTEWQCPTNESRIPVALEVLCVDEKEFENKRFAVIRDKTGHRRFEIRFPSIVMERLCIQSSELPESFAWIDGNLCSERLPKYGFLMTDEPSFLLELFISSVCKVASRRPSSLGPINDLDLENIRRIGYYLRKRLDCEQDIYEPRSLSIEAIPALETFASSIITDDVNMSPSLYLTKIIESITASIKGHINLMSLTGDFLFNTKESVQVCPEILWNKCGNKCFESNVECLLKAILQSKKKGILRVSPTGKCHVGFTELFAPVFVDGLIVCLVFVGQLIGNEEDARKINEYISSNTSSGRTSYHMSEITDITQISRIKQVISGLSILIGTLFKKHNITKNWVILTKELVYLRVNKQRDIFQKACCVLKKSLVASECSAFRLEGDYLILEATTSEKLIVRQKTDGLPKLVRSEEAIGKVYYRRGEGLTGGVVNMNKCRFEPIDMKAVDWIGRCSEIDTPAQFFATPIMGIDKCYGVIRTVSPSYFPNLFETRQEQLTSFATMLGVVLHNYELANVETEAFKEKAEALQAILAEAAHEYRSPLHNVLSLSSAMQHTSNKNNLSTLYQKMREEIYRAKRILDNYLMRGVTDRENIKYNFQLHSISKLISDCISRFKSHAENKNIRIKTERLGFSLPELVFDYDRMDQVFSNIIDNAVKYAFNNTEILIRARNKLNTVTISVTDMGLGIPKESMKQIFEGYQHLAEDKRKFKPGTGLGLMIAQRIVQAHNGNIHVESEPYWNDPKRLALLEGYKTKFSISLPKKDPRNKKV